MEPLKYWQLKTFQLLHDPPGKPFHLAPRGKGAKASFLKHAELARELFFLFSGADAPKGMTRPDCAATGADRPLVGQAGAGDGCSRCPIRTKATTSSRIRSRATLRLP